LLVYEFCLLLTGVERTWQGQSRLGCICTGQVGELLSHFHIFLCINFYCSM